MTPKAIETQYKGYRFRSRLEARWAVFFDALGLRWQYELEGLEVGENCRYLPDFFLPDWRIHLEVKPDLPRESLIPTDGKAFIISVFEHDKGHTAVGKFLLAWAALMERREEGDPPRAVHKPGIYMLCGTPWMPSLENRCGQWVLKDGAVALGVLPGPNLGFSVHAWCEGGGGLDLNTFYLNAPLPRDGGVFNQTVYSPVWPSELMPCLYVGNGRDYFSPRLKKAYRAARSARFEHGEGRP